MSFPLYFSKKIAFSKDNKNNLSRVIITIGRISVALGIIVSLITIASGLGSKKAIKERVGDFSGHISIKSTRSNSSYNSSPIELSAASLKKILAVDGVENIQKFASVSGILRNAHNFDGIIFKGIGKDFQAERFQKFLIAGNTPKITENGYNNSIVISDKIAKDLQLKVKDSIVSIFSREDQQPIYRKFEVCGIYKTDIKMIDDFYVIGDINQAKKILNFSPEQVGGYDVFLENIDTTPALLPQIENLAGIKNYTEAATQKYPQIVDWLSIFDTNIGLIIFIMLLVVVINIIMVLLILIIERTNSIGMLKTLGASNVQIRQIFINYTLLIMVPGLIIGNIIGILMLLLQKFFGIIKLNPENYYVREVPVEINIFHILLISAGMLLVAAFALILPSWLISKISPLKAIKYE